MIVSHGFAGKTKVVCEQADDGGTALYLAAQEGHTDCVKLLLQYGADANQMTVHPGVALPLHAAVHFSRLE